MVRFSRSKNGKRIQNELTMYMIYLHKQEAVSQILKSHFTRHLKWLLSPNFEIAENVQALRFTVHILRLCPVVTVFRNSRLKLHRATCKKHLLLLLDVFIFAHTRSYTQSLLLVSHNMLQGVCCSVCLRALEESSQILQRDAVGVLRVDLCCQLK